MAARSPFSDEIERAPMPSRFTRPSFNSYDGKTDPVEHVSHYIHMMSLHAHNDALMCKVFPSSLGSTALRWFNGLRKGSIRSFAELIQEFGSRFVTCSRVQQPVDALLYIKMKVWRNPSELCQPILGTLQRNRWRERENCCKHLQNGAPRRL